MLILNTYVDIYDDSKWDLNTSYVDIKQYKAIQF